MTKYINDWEKVVRGLIRHINKNGFTVVAADDGESDSITGTVHELAAEACAADMGHLHVKNDGETRYVLLVLGNSPSETVADWSYPKNSITEPVFEKVISDWSDSWVKRGDACPKKEWKR